MAQRITSLSDPLPLHLARERDTIRAIARDYGLDFFEVIYEMVDFQQMNELAAYMGFPVRYPHWRWGMEYERMRKSYDYGLHKIYEMVVNNDPSYAYLLESNELIDQKIVMAHVYGHSDFFKNNLWFSQTKRKMMDEMANHATRVRRIIERIGMDEVEEWIDVCLSLENLIDRHAPYRAQSPLPSHEDADLEVDLRRPVASKLRSDRGYMDTFINPPGVVKAEAEARNEALRSRTTRFPSEPQTDVLLFLLENGPLERWQQDILDIVREEAYYFAPQGMTKTLNEGWASFWHTTIMTKSGVMTDAEVVDYADHHSGTVAMSPQRINPYKIGLELLRDIEERWNKGQFGKDWDECDDARAKREWDLQLGLGKQKLFEVRRIYNDIGFIDTFFTEDFCNRHQLFTYHYNERTGRYEIESREFQALKQKLLFMLTNFGQPTISVQDANYENRGALLLKHRYEGIELKLDEARDTIKNLYAVWKRPIYVETIIDDTPRLLSFDGREHATKRIR